ncbi:MAG TPA: hypothetical protein VMW16_01585 [Sedimentisphaerales bacterium]|nr:hypothetical protein [Sedimentisphaerales bacterium]
MNFQDQENLKALFGKFISAEEAENALEDIQKGEQILCEHPAPEPSSELIASIKGETAKVLRGRQANAFRRAVYRTAAVAAAFIVAAVVGVNLFEKGSARSERLISQAIWESDNIAADDTNLATLIAEAEQLEGEMMALQLGETGGNGHRDLLELEMELVEIDSEFWKG